MLVHESEYWRVIAQRGFLLPVGAPGSIAIWGKDPARHESFSQHICAEKLIEHVAGERADYYKWQQQSTQPNDWLDGLAGCNVALCKLGAYIPGTGAPIKKRGRRRKRRRATYTEV